MKKQKVGFFRKIQFRLIISFMVPVLCIIALGMVSYQRASSAILNNYKSASQQTADMMEQYLSLIISSEREDFKSYLAEESLSHYYKGMLERSEEITVANNYKEAIRDKLLRDSKIKNVYFLSDDEKSIYTVTAKVAGDAYSQYRNTIQGQAVAENAYEWHLFGSDPGIDEQVGMLSGNYSLRIVRDFNKFAAIMVVDLDVDLVRGIMQSMDVGAGGSVLLVTSDGREFSSNAEADVQTPLVYGTSFYQNALESEDFSGNQNVFLDGEEYLFVYSRLTAGDLTVHLKSKHKDEFGLLCAGINDTVSHVKSLIVQVNEVSTLLNSDASYVNDASQVFMETSSDIQKAVSEIEVGVERLDSGSEDCLSQMDMLSGKISNVSQNTDQISQLITAVGSTIGSGIESVQELTSSAQRTSQITKEVIEAIQELEEKSDSINKIVSAINDIAEQTNLLSLNASIEAARAGDAGRGFAVVAEEIRKLSDQCLTSASQISDIVREIADKTGQVVVTARQAEEIVSTQAGAVEETTSAFQLINEQVESLLGALNIISGNVQEIDTSRTQTLGAIEGISAVSAETAACSSSVHSTAGTQLDAVRDLENASNQLRERADRLIEVLGSFIVS